ncbi:MAG TPA: hypothetical protein VJJ52_07030, partial [Candidatus Nanoarchaeia archaeon]|nr:hypothetical protein [Candidatus Nanoarchaeia archaeon]
ILADRKAGKIYVLRSFKKPMLQRHQINSIYGQETTDEMKWNRESFIKISKTRVYAFKIYLR